MREQMVLDEKIIGVELSSNKKQFKWPVQENEKKSTNNDDDNESSDDMSALQKIFVLQSAVLGVGAKENQRNLVHLTIKDPADDKVILDQPIFSLSLNKTDSISALNLRILLTETTEITFKLVEGDGPVHLITSKILEPPLDMGGYSSDDDDDEFDNMSVTSDEDVNAEALGAGGDRKTNVNLSSGKGGKKSKKTPANESNSHNNASDVQQQKKKRKKTE